MYKNVLNGTIEIVFSMTAPRTNQKRPVRPTHFWFVVRRHSSSHFASVAPAYHRVQSSAKQSVCCSQCVVYHRELFAVDAISILLRDVGVIASAPRQFVSTTTDPVVNRTQHDCRLPTGRISSTTLCATLLCRSKPTIYNGTIVRRKNRVTV
jgi:hypothetical protein